MFCISYHVRVTRRECHGLGWLGRRALVSDVTDGAHEIAVLLGEAEQGEVEAVGRVLDLESVIFNIILIGILVFFSSLFLFIDFAYFNGTVIYGQEREG